jgi:hypothetical protein
VWLTEGIWATHGHYLDRHLLPETTFGVAREMLSRPPRDEASPIEYEADASESESHSGLAALARWPVKQAGRAVQAVAFPLAFRLVNPGMAPLTAPLLNFQMRHATVPALARVAQRLGVDADVVIFGHVHRLGPLPGDAREDWLGPDGSMRLVNTGSWVYEPLLLHRAVPPHPYWPGGAVMLEDGEEPRPVGLLDDLSPAQLRGGKARPAPAGASV